MKSYKEENFYIFIWPEYSSAYLNALYTTNKQKFNYIYYAIALSNWHCTATRTNEIQVTFNANVPFISFENITAHNQIIEKTRPN